MEGSQECLASGDLAQDGARVCERSMTMPAVLGSPAPTSLPSQAHRGREPGLATTPGLLGSPRVAAWSWDQGRASHLLSTLHGSGRTS